MRPKWQALGRDSWLGMDYGLAVARTRAGNHQCVDGVVASAARLHGNVCRFTCLTILTTVFLACGSQRGTVGIRFGRDLHGNLFARDVPAGLGAANAGVRAGDQVILIDGRDVRSLSDEAIHSILGGERGTRVRVTVLRGEEALRFSVERTSPPQLRSKQ